MQIRLVTGVGLAVAFVGGWACSASSSPPRYPDVQSFCEAKAKGECQIASLCAVDPMACQAARTAQCTQDAASATAAGSRKYVASNAQACIDLVNDAYGGGHSEIPYAKLFGQGSITDKCERVFSGETQKLLPCANDYECADGRVCAAAAPGSPQNVCADPAPKSAGDPCADPGSVCPADTFCSTADGGVVASCVPAAQAGEPCGAAPCVSSDRCSGGFCIVRVGVSQPCTKDDDCVTAAPYCDPNAGSICTIGLTFATMAADCRAYGMATNAPPAGSSDASVDGAPTEAGTGDASGQ